MIFSGISPSVKKTNEKKNKNPTENSDSDFEENTFDKYKIEKKEDKGKRLAVRKDSDVFFQSKKKAKTKDNMIVCYPQAIQQKKPKKADQETIKYRMSPRNLQKVLNNLSPQQDKRVREMGFGDFPKNFNIYYIPSTLGLFLATNFDSETRTLGMGDGRKIKFTKQLVHDMLGIPMGDIPVETLKEKNLLEPTTQRWRRKVKHIVGNDKKIGVSKLESFLSEYEKANWVFDVGFLSLFFSIIGEGNKDGTINERLIPFIGNNTDRIEKMDWCSYVLECLVRECTSFDSSSTFSGPLVLLTVSTNLNLNAVNFSLNCCKFFT